VNIYKLIALSLRQASWVGEIGYMRLLFHGISWDC